MIETLSCSVRPSGWARGSTSPVAFADGGRDLAVELRRWSAGDDLETTGGEEVGAVLEGRFELVLAEETHVLEAGAAVVIPPGAPHRWRVLGATGVLYRVVARAAGTAKP